MSSHSAYRLSPIAKQLLLCVLSSILLILSFPNFNLWIFAWFGFVPLFFVLEGKNRTQAFLLSYFTGVIFWSGTIYWLIHVTLPGTILLILYLALYFGFFGLAVSYTLPTIYSLLLLPSLWVLLEYLRSHLLTGFPWALLGYSQYLNLPAIQIADITGAWGVSFLIMLVNIACYLLVRRSEFRVQSLKIYILPIFCLIISLTYGYYKLLQTKNYEFSTKISVIQANIPQNLKWDTQAKDFIFGEYFALSSSAAKEKPDLIVWPEAASPAIIGEEPRYFEKIKLFAESVKTPLLFGAVVSQGGTYYNSALLVSSRGELLGRYNKLHLVPFGEYVPLKNIFGFLETVVPIGEVAPGKDYTIFKLPESSSQLLLKFAVLVCFEDLFPELSREFRRRGADFLVNITNDAWYKRTSAPLQHLQASVFRAVENRINLIRAANTGVSAFILPSGKIVSLASDCRGRSIFIRGYKTEDVFVSGENRSLYTCYGDIFILACLIFILYAIIVRFKK